MRRGFQNRLRAHGEVAEMISRFSHRYAMKRPSKRATEHGADVLHAGIGERTERDHDGQREFLDQREDFLVGPVDRHHVVDLQNEAVQRDLHPVVVVLETLHLHQHRVPRVRPALQLVKTKPGNSIVSSCFILVRPSATGDNDVLAMADCAINIKPNEDELVEIASETVSCAKIFGIDPKVAFLSYSTFGSGKGEDVDKMRNAAEKAKLAMPNVPIEGELQFDAAVSPRVAQTKCKGSKVAGYANTFIFPDINAGNIGYKIAQRLGSFEAYGPILLGLNAPINDLSRGCNAQEVYSMAIITAALA